MAAITVRIEIETASAETLYVTGVQGSGHVHLRQGLDTMDLTWEVSERLIEALQLIGRR